MRKFLFDVECFIRDGESFFSLRFMDLKIISDDLFTAYVNCHNYIHHFLNGFSFFFIIKNVIDYDYYE